MEYAKDEVFSISYNKKLDKQNTRLRKMTRGILNNKFITILITMGILFSTINFTLIYFFFQTLNSIALK